MNPRILEQGFDKFESFWRRRGGVWGGEEAFFPERGLLPSPHFAFGKKEQEGGVLPNWKKINILSRNTSCSGTVSGFGDRGAASLATRKKQWNSVC